MKYFKHFCILIVGAMPILLVLTSDQLSELIKVEDKNYFEFIKAILPLVFSIIVLLINSILTDKKDQEEKRKVELTKVNGKVKSYNLIFLHAQKMYHAKMRNLRQTIAVTEFFFQVPILQPYYQKWFNHVQYNLDGSNHDDLRVDMRKSMLDLVNHCCQTEEYLNYFEYLSNAEQYSLESRFLNEDQEIFISQFSNDKIHDHIEKNMVLAASEILSHGGSSKYAIEQYNYNISEFKKVLSGPTTSKIFYDKAYGAVINLLFLSECLITDLSIIELSLKVFSRKYNEFYQLNKIEFPEIDSAFSIGKFEIPQDVNKYFVSEAALRKYGLV